MSQTMTLRNDNRPWYKEPWPWILMAGPTIVVIAGLTTAWLAVKSNDGLVADDYYKQGLAVNQSLHRDQQASALGLTANLMRADKNIRLLIESKSGASLPPKITLKLMHPTRAGHDELVEMNADRPGFYTGKLSEEIAGRWLVSIEDPAGAWRLQGDWKSDLGEPQPLTAKAGK